MKGFGLNYPLIPEVFLLVKAEVFTEVPGRLGWFVMCLRSQGGMSRSGHNPSCERWRSDVHEEVLGQLCA